MRITFQCRVTRWVLYAVCSVLHRRCCIRHATLHGARRISRSACGTVYVLHVERLHAPSCTFASDLSSTRSPTSSTAHRYAEHPYRQWQACAIPQSAAAFASPQCPLLVPSVPSTASSAPVSARLAQSHPSSALLVLSSPVIVRARCPVLRRMLHVASIHYVERRALHAESCPSYPTP